MIYVNTQIEFIDLTTELEGDAAAVKGILIPEAAPATATDIAAAIEQIRSDQEDVVVFAADHSVVIEVKRVAIELAKSQLLTARLVDAMFVPGGTVSPVAARQAQRNAEARQELIDEFGLYDSEDVAELAGSTASNRSATASRWLGAKKIFAVNHRRALVYPGFQFGTDGRPRAVIARVLEAFEPFGLDGWETALWFTTASGWLDDRRPVDLLTREPENVVDAARRAFDEVPA
jgi:hypothetical protein